MSSFDTLVASSVTAINVAAASLSATALQAGTATAEYYYGNGSRLTGIVTTTTDAGALTQGTLNNARLPAAIATDTVTARAFFGDGAGLTGVATANATSLTTGTLNNARLDPNVTVTGTVTADKFVGNGSRLTGIVAQAVVGDAGALVGTLSNARLPADVVVANKITANAVAANAITTTGDANVGGYVLNSYFQRAMVNQAMQTHYNAEIIRSMGSSGLCSLRAYRTDMSLLPGQPAREFHVRQLHPIAQTIHSHPENEGVLGLAEIACIVNGFYIRTQHNDPRVLDASNNMLIAPPVPAAVLAKPTGVSYDRDRVTNVFDTVNDTQARYISTFFTNPAGFRSAEARLDMLYFEVWLEDASGSDTLTTAQESSRHYDLSNTLVAALKRVLEQTTPGGKDTSENVSFKSGLTVDIGTDGRPKFCAVNFRIRAATVGTMEDRTAKDNWSDIDDPPEMVLSTVSVAFGGTHGHEVPEIAYDDTFDGTTRVLDYLLADSDNRVYIESRYNSATVEGRHSHLQEVSWNGRTFVLRDAGAGSSGSDGSLLPTPFLATNADATKVTSATNAIYAPIVTRYRTFEGVWVGNGTDPAVEWTNFNTTSGTAKDNTRPHTHGFAVTVLDSRFPYDPFKAANGILDDTNRFALLRDEELLLPGESWEDFAASSRARFGMDAADYRSMVGRVWGLDGIDAAPLYDTFNVNTFTLTGRPLNMARYNRAYGLPTADASGRTAAPRGFNDPHLNVARTTNPLVVGGYTYMIPLELVCRTPLESWNPYDVVPSTGTTMFLSKTAGVGAGYAAVRGVILPAGATFPLGTGYTSVPVVTVTPGNGNGVGARITAVVAGGKITAFTVVSGGGGYITPPTITITGGGGSFAGTLAVDVNAAAPVVRFVGGRGSGQKTSDQTDATATATVTSTGTLTLAVTGTGAGYVRSPQVVFEGGSGAVRLGEVNAYITGTTGTTGPRPAGDGYTSIIRVNGVPLGTGYATPPDVVFTPTNGGVGAKATAVVTGGVVTAINVTAAGTGYRAPPIVTLSNGGGTYTGTLTAVVRDPWTLSHPVNDNAGSTGGHYITPAGLIDQVKTDAADTTSGAARWVRGRDGNAYPMATSGPVAGRDMGAYTYPSGEPLTKAVKLRYPIAPVWMDSSQSSVRLRATNAVAQTTRAGVTALRRAVPAATAGVIERALESTWIASDTAFSYMDAAWSPELQLFAAVGTAGSVAWSADGLAWTRTAVGTATWIAVTWSADLAVFVAISASAAIASTDGKTWKSTALPASQLAGGGALTAVAAGMGGVTAVTTTSATQYVLLATANAATIAVPVIGAPTAGGYAITASSDAANAYMVTDANPTTYWANAAYTGSNFRYDGAATTVVRGVGAVSGEYLQLDMPAPARVTQYAIGAPAPNNAPVAWVLAGSNDGVEWTRLDARASNVFIAPTYVPPPGVACSRLRLIVTQAMGASALRVAEWGVTVQPEVLSWRAARVPTRTLRGVAYSPELRMWVATTISYMAFSGDALVWTLTPTFGAAWNSVAWSPLLGMFAAVTAGPRVITSTDGRTWIMRLLSGPSSDNYTAWDRIIWAAELGAFVATGPYTPYNAGKLLISQDGLVWRTIQGPPASRFRAVAWSPELSVMTAVSDVGTPRVAATAPIAPASKSTLMVSPAQVRYAANTLAVTGGVAANTLTLSPGASQTPVANGSMTFEFTSNTAVTIRARGSDGVLRSAVLPLA